MKKNETTIPGCFVLEPLIYEDVRGRLVKIFHKDSYLDLGLETNFTEEYYSVSNKNILRGLHFQLPPHDHVKCVTCLLGKIFDVVVDLRTDSPTYKQYFSIELDAEKGNMLYIPKGFAHGFQVISKTAIFLNRTTTVYHPQSEFGIRWDTCGINWPNMNPILSEKDKQLGALNNFKSPF